MIPKFSHKSTVTSSGAYFGYYVAESESIWSPSFDHRGQEKESRPYRKQVKHNELGPAYFKPGADPFYYLHGKQLSKYDWADQAQKFNPELTDEYIVWLRLHYG